MFTNIRSVIRNCDELSSVIDVSSSDVVALTETWLSSAVRDYEIFDCTESYRFFRSGSR